MGRRKKTTSLEEIVFRTRNIRKHTCPIANISYYGNCPNYTCPYNLVRLTNGEKTGCFNESCSPILDEIGRMLKLNRSQMKAKYQDSMLRLERSVSLYHDLSTLRQEVHHAFLCRNCGAPLSSGIECVNPIKCQKRQEIVKKILEFSILASPGLNGTARDVWLIAEHYSYESFMEKYNFLISKRIWNYLPPLLANRVQPTTPELTNV